MMFGFKDNSNGISGNAICDIKRNLNEPDSCGDGDLQSAKMRYPRSFGLNNCGS